MVKVFTEKKMDWDQPKAGQRGLTFIELLIFIGFGSVMIVALMMMVARTFTVSRQQLEQGAITEKARVQLERMSDEIRNAQYVDCNLDGDTGDINEHWLYGADNFEIIVLSNVDDDVEAERLRYFVETGVTGEEYELKRGVMQPGGSLCDWTGPESVQTVLNSLRNVDPDPDVPLLQYYTSGDDNAILSTPVVRLSSVLRIRLDLHIDETANVNPGEVEVITDVVPRGVRDPGACVDPGISVTRYNYTSTTIDFGDTAFADCQSYCQGSSVLGSGQCCPWSATFSWQGNPNWYVWSACQCADTYLPLDITPDPVNVGGYTDYAKECLGGARCGGQKGEPICDAGCLAGQGQCVCVCPNGFPVTTACNDGFDNDGDGTADCTGCTLAPTYAPDPGCANANDSSEWGTAQCDDGLDNDSCDGTDYKLSGSGDVDCSDPTDNTEDPCSAGPSIPPSVPPCVPTEGPLPQCNDGFDNDCAGDGIDYAGVAGDLQCLNVDDNNEWSINKQCHDGVDNDADGQIDCPQAACSDSRPGSEIPDTDCAGPDGDSEFPAPPSVPPSTPP